MNDNNDAELEQSSTLINKKIDLHRSRKRNLQLFRNAFFELLTGVSVVMLLSCSQGRFDQDEKNFSQAVKNLASGKENHTSLPTSKEGEQSTGYVVQLKKLTHFDWDTVCPSFAYEDSTEFRKRLGLKETQFQKDQEWQGDEVTIRLAFINNNQLVKVIRISRSQAADFLPSQVVNMSRCFGHNEAQILVQKMAPGSGLPPVLIAIFNQ